MYGHTAGCADDFVYRKPYEFIAHVVWLLSDSVKQMDCQCTPCHRATGRPIKVFVTRLEAEADAEAAAEAALQVGSQAPKPAEPRAVKKAIGSRSTTTTKKKAPTTSADYKPPTTTTSVPPARAAKKATAAKPSSTSRPSQSQSTMPTAIARSGPAAAPAPPPARAPAAAVTPATKGEPTLFRRGEMVWAQQITVSPGWRIGIVREIRRSATANTDEYVIIALAHSSIDIPDYIRDVQFLRPFLTFSVPAINHPNLKGHEYSWIEWDEVLGPTADPAFTREMTGLEASKLAALEVDGSWSTFNKLQPKDQKQKQDEGKIITLYGGAYLGAEMICLGDPIRHKEKNRDSLLEVLEIYVVHTLNPAPNYPKDDLFFKGVEYEATLVDENAKIGRQPEGAIFAKDTAFRSLAAKAAAARAGGKPMKCVWVVSAYWNSLPFSSLSSLLV